MSPGDLPLVSVVTPTLQRGDYLERTLRSVRAQTYPNIEHIVIDGGSTDGSLDLLRAFEGTYNLRWVSEPDRGMYDAINKGLGMASGEIIAYLNSDDLYFPWTIEVGVTAFADHPDADIVYGDAIRVDEIRKWVVPIFVPPFNARQMAAFGSLRQPAVLIRRHVLETLRGFDARLAYVADLDFWLRAATQFTFARIPEFLALEQWHSGMFSESKRAEMAGEGARVRAAYGGRLRATWVGRLAAYVRWHGWTGVLWLRFARASRGGAGWRRTIDACLPTVSAWRALIGVLPSKGSRLRSRITWGSDPLTVASATDLGRPL